MPEIKGVLFDFDGTVMDTNEVIIKSWNHLYRNMLGREADPEVIKATFGEPLPASLARLFPQSDVDEMVEFYRSYQQEVYMDSISLFPGIKECMEQLKAMGVKLGIVTSRGRDSTSRGLGKYGMERDFDAIVSAGDTEVHKPNPQPCLLCLEKLGLKPEEAVMVGDSRFDVLCARNAGARSALVAWSISLGEEEISGDLRPDYYIEKAEDIAEIVRKSMLPGEGY